MQPGTMEGAAARSGSGSGHWQANNVSNSFILKIKTI